MHMQRTGDRFFARIMREKGSTGKAALPDCDTSSYLVNLANECDRTQRGGRRNLEHIFVSEERNRLEKQLP